MPQTLLACPRGSDTVHFRVGLGVYIDVLRFHLHAFERHKMGTKSTAQKASHVPNVSVARTGGTLEGDGAEEL